MLNSLSYICFSPSGSGCVSMLRRHNSSVMHTLGLSVYVFTAWLIKCFTWSQNACDSWCVSCWHYRSLWPTFTGRSNCDLLLLVGHIKAKWNESFIFGRPFHHHVKICQMSKMTHNIVLCRLCCWWVYIAVCITYFWLAFLAIFANIHI